MDSKLKRIFVVGYPGSIGGACTELWHTLKLWRSRGLKVELIPTWGADPTWRPRVDEIGCVTHEISAAELPSVPGLEGSTVVSFCNAEFLKVAATLRRMDCRLVWVNCMTFLFDAERQFYKEHGPFDAFVFQSEFQRSVLEPELSRFGYTQEQGNLIRGAFDLDEFQFAPRPHEKGDEFVVGRMARPDLDKWSSNTWPIYSSIQYAQRRALMLGMDRRTHAKLGTPPLFAECLGPMAIPVSQYLTNLHCLLPINGGARENWPRAGLEAMAAGVPIVAQNQWGWPEMIQHGVTGFLANDDCELAHCAAVLAYDEQLRLDIARNARRWLETELANPEKIWNGWQSLFNAGALVT